MTLSIEAAADLYLALVAPVNGAASEWEAYASSPTDLDDWEVVQVLDKNYQTAQQDLIKGLVVTLWPVEVQPYVDAVVLALSDDIERHAALVNATSQDEYWAAVEDDQQVTTSWSEAAQALRDQLGLGSVGTDQ